MRIAASARRLGTLALIALPLMASRAAAEARAIDADGRLVVVGNFRHLQQGNSLRRVADANVLGFEIIDGGGYIVGHGIVPGSESAGADTTPSFARDPLTDSLWLTWSRRTQDAPASEVVFIRSSSGIFWPSTLRVAASGAGDQVDPAMIFDSTGRILLAWADAGNGFSVELASFMPSGTRLASRTLSDNAAIGNSAPAIGVDADGHPLVAFLGHGASDGSQRLFVLAASPQPGGFTHLPDPIVILGFQGDAPTPAIPEVPTPEGSRIAGQVHLSVLAGTPVAWWAESDGTADLALDYAIPTEDGWSGTVVQRIALGPAVTSVGDALILVEARLRGMVDVSDGVGDPGLRPSPISVGRPDLTRVRQVGSVRPAGL